MGAAQGHALGARIGFDEVVGVRGITGEEAPVHGTILRAVIDDQDSAKRLFHDQDSFGRITTSNQ